jgi:hypothetical protein
MSLEDSETDHLLSDAGRGQEKAREERALLGGNEEGKVWRLVRDLISRSGEW